MDGRKKAKDVSTTAKPVLAWKLVTSAPSFWKKKGCGNRETPLSHNTCAEIFLTAEEIEQVKNNPNLDNVKTVSVRERWINKLYEKYIKEFGYKQILILGSGFDIRAFKKNKDNQKNKKNAELYAKIKFWEVDKTEILDAKEQIFLSKNLDKNAIYIKADYTGNNFINMLINNGLNLNVPTVIIFEGNLMYLENSQVLKLFAILKEKFNKFVIAFDYFPQTLINMIANKSPEGSNESLWKTGIENLTTFAKQCGLIIVDNKSIGELSKKEYYDVDNNSSYGANNYFVCALRK